MFKFRSFGVMAAIGIILLINSMALAGGRNNNISTAKLSDQEIEDLQHLRDEEKLARDVYLYFYDIYGKPIFSNIAASEQQHMDAVKTLLDRYGINDPVSGLERGEFAYYQELYDQLTADGTPAEGEQLLDALQRALYVGATIEDMDIVDIQIMITHTNRFDLINVYENLMKGSRNHLRSYCDLLYTLYDYEYIAQFLSQGEVDAILDSDKEIGKR